MGQHRPKLLLTGASGLFGTTAARYFSKQADTYGVYHSREVQIPGIKMIKADIRDTNALNILLDDIKPDYIIHAAALVDVDKCESHPDECYLINVRPVELLSNYCEKNNVKLVFLSTDAFFNLQNRKFANESETPVPISEYGNSKLQAEKIIQQTNSSAIIVRTNIYGWRPLSDRFSLAEWMLDAFINKKPITLVGDIYYTPIFTKTLSQAIHCLMEQNESGIFHIAGTENISKLEFGYKLAKVFGLSTQYVKPVSIDDLGLKAKRSKNMALCVDKFRNRCPGILNSVDKDLVTFRDLILSGNVNRLRQNNENAFYLD